MSSRLTTAVLAVLLLLPAAGSTQSADSTSQRWPIGVAVPLSGSAAWLGQSTRQGIELYLSEHPEFAARTEFIYQDAGTHTVTNGVSAVQALVDVNKVKALIIENSNVTNAVAPLLDKRHVPAIAVTGSDAARGRAYMVKLWFPLSSEAKALQDHIVSHNISPVVMVTTEQDSMLDRTKVLSALLENKISIAGSLNITTPDDVPAVAAKVSKLAPQAVVLNLMPGQCGLFTKKLRELGYSGAFLSNIVASEESEIKLSGGALRGAIYPSFYQTSLFSRSFKAKYGLESYGAAAVGYDSAKLLDQAFKAVSGDYSPEKLVAALKVKHFTGAMGEYGFGSDSTNNFDIPVMLKTHLNL